MTLYEQLKKIKMVLFDVDGVLSDGRIIIDNNGMEYKSFYARDGLGIKMLIDHGIVCGVITGRESGIVTHRMEELKIEEVHQGVKDKLKVYEDIKTKYGFDDSEIAFVGDDIPELDIFMKVGIAFAVGDAHPELKKYADYITQAKGGKGAVREITDLIMEAHGWPLYVPKI